MIASVLQCEYIKHGMTCGLANGGVALLLFAVLVVVGFSVIAYVNRR